MICYHDGCEAEAVVVIQVSPVGPLQVGGVTASCAEHAPVIAENVAIAVLISNRLREPETTEDLDARALIEEHLKPC